MTVTGFSRCLLLFATIVSTTMCADMVPAQSLGSPLIPEIAAQRYGLTRSWFAHVDLDRARDRIQNITLHDGRLFVQTKRGVIQALDSETGKSVWVTRVGSPEHPTTAVGASDAHVAALNGSSLYVLERATGKQTFSRRVTHTPIAGPGLSPKYAFVSTTTGHLEAYDLEDPRKPVWLYNAGGRGLVQPMITPTSVGWPTDRGLFYVAEREYLNIRFRTEARDQIVAQPAYISPYFYVGSLDGYLYKVHERTGKIAWRFSTGEPVVERPVAAAGRIYITAQHGGLYAVLADLAVAEEAAAAQLAAADKEGAKDKEAAAAAAAPDADAEPQFGAEDEGSEIWWTPGIVKLLAVTPSRVYGLDRSNRIVIMRAETGTPLAWMPTEHLSLGVINHVSDRLYVGTDTGLIQCLHEPALTEPLSYVVDEAPAEGPAEVKQQGLDDEAQAGDGGAEDLFGGDRGGDDPFGADPFKTDDKAGDKGAGDDPFGADPFGGGADPFQGGAGDDKGADDKGADDKGGDAGGNDDPFGTDPFG